jgi:hypothetical protein
MKFSEKIKIDYLLDKGKILNPTFGVNLSSPANALCEIQNMIHIPR